jgi:molybdate transport system regulatory protein
MAIRRPVPEVRPRIRVTRGAEILLGPGKADLLEAIRRAGSLRGAAAAAGLSYMRAWNLVQILNRAFREPLVETERGGSRRGRAVLTPLGEEVLLLYRAMEAESAKAIAPAWRRLRRRLREGDR